MRSVRALAAGALLALVAVCCGGDPTASRGPSAAPSRDSGPSFDAVVAAVEDRLEVYDGLFTGAVVLVRVGDRAQVVTSGLSDVRDERPMAEDQTFPIASVTKPMVATVVLQLVEEGRLALEDDVRRILPALHDVGSPITVEQLLSHRSGLDHDPSNADLRRLGTGATAALVAATAGRGPEFTPGTRGRYSNVGYGALGLLVEEVLDRPLARVLSQRVFTPSGMKEASLGGRPEVQGYADGTPVRHYYLDYLPAAGSVVATAGDLDRFFRALWAGELVPDHVVAAMRRSHGTVDMDAGFYLDYGLGLMMRKVGCGMSVGHSGRIGGFTVEAWTLQGSEQSVVVMINDENADDVARGIVETALCGG